MGLSPLLLVGPFVAAIGLVAVFFVMRHRSVQEKSMYSSRRAQIERKVRAARQRTLAPTSKQAQANQPPQAFAAPGMEAKEAIPTATWGPPTARPEPPPPPPDQMAWEVGPTVPPPTMPPPTMPPSMPEPSPYAPTETPFAPAAADAVWTPAPIEQAPSPMPEPMTMPAPAPVETPMTSPSGGGAAWSIVGDTKDAVADAEITTKRPKKERQAQATGSWSLSSGELPGEEDGEEVKLPRTAVAIAQYAVLVVGLVMVLIGVLVMVANSHVT